MAKSIVDAMREQIKDLPREEQIARVRAAREMESEAAIAARERAVRLTDLLLELEGPAQHERPERARRVTGFATGVG